MAQNSPWFTEWFNQDYIHLYSNRSAEEANRQVAFILDHVPLPQTGSVIDLGCGEGRHVLAMGRRGHRVFGIDLSPHLVSEGKKKVKRCPRLDVQLVQGDVFNYPFATTFDLVLNLFTSFGYFGEDRTNERFFQLVCSLMKPQGYFFFDYLNPEHIRATLTPYEEREVLGERVKISRWVAGDRVHKKIVFPGRVYWEKVKLYSRDVLERMMEKHGLVVCEAWSNYRGDPWVKMGERQLFLCTSAQSGPRAE